MAHPLLRFAAAATVAIAALAAAGAWPTHALAGLDGLVAMALAAGISLGGAVLGFLPTALAGRTATLERRANASMIGLGVRMLLTLVAVLVLLQVGAVAARSAFAVWVGADYLALLVLESVLLVRAARASGGGPPGVRSA